MLFGILTTDENHKKTSPREEADKIAEESYMQIYKYCRLELADKHEYAYDITNDVFVVLYEKWDSLKNEHIQTWVHTKKGVESIDENCGKMYNKAMKMGA